MSDQRDLISPNYNQPTDLPNATAILVLGIVAIIGGLCYGILGLICGIIGLILANNDRKLYNSAPDLYSQASLSNSNAGRICSIVGISLGTLWVLIFVFVVAYNLLRARTNVF